MATSPDQLTREIGTTRQRMDTTLDDMEGRVDPRQVWERRQPSLRSKVSHMKDTVMGKAEDVSGQAQEGVQSMGNRLASGTDGNPLAAGLIAFGAGLLAGSLMPSSQTERKMVRELQGEVGEPVRQALQNSAHEVRDRVGDEMQHAMDTTKESASESTQHVADSARESTGQVRDQAESAAQDVRRDIEGT